MIDLDALGHDLAAAYGRRVDRDRRRRRRVRTGGAVAVLAFAFAAVAAASGIGPDLQLNPAEWSILGGGSTDGGRGQYVHEAHGRRIALDVHRRARRGAGAVRGLLAPRAHTCGRGCDVARSGARRARPRVHRRRADARRVRGARRTPFRNRPGGRRRRRVRRRACRGLEYTTERASAVYSGKEPGSMLMPGVG